MTNLPRSCSTLPPKCSTGCVGNKSVISPWCGWSKPTTATGDLTGVVCKLTRLPKTTLTCLWCSASMKVVSFEKSLALAIGNHYKFKNDILLRITDWFNNQLSVFTCGDQRGRDIDGSSLNPDSNTSTCVWFCSLVGSELCAKYNK
jgi:hypothetical protein